MDRYTIRVTAWHARKARKIGNGNQSEGFRVAVEYMVEREGLK